MKIAVAQMNPTVGDIKNNAVKALDIAHKAHNLGAQLVIFPELFICGYPPKDLLLRPDFLAQVQDTLELLAQRLPVAALMGAPFKAPGSKKLYNAALFMSEGQVKLAAAKRLLPNYNVFDEKRYFISPKEQAADLLEYLGQRLLISICEDAWNGPHSPEPTHHCYDPIALGMETHKNIDLIINISASPYSLTKPKIREHLFCEHARRYEKPLLLCGQVGANDQLLFDGHSLVIDKHGEVIKRARSCQEDLLIYDTSEPSSKKAPPMPKAMTLLRDALVMGIKDYVEKCHSPGVLLGLSGGIDSAVCAALGVRALGPERVKAVFLPSKYSSASSRADAEALAHKLGIDLEIMPINSAVDTFNHTLSAPFAKASPAKLDLAEQNLQARIRAIVLMALSNTTDYLLMATSNKSELAVGYATLYGDMCGAFSALGDVYKSDVWHLAHVINEQGVVIPQSIIDKAPSAELKADQRDDQTLPPYPILDQILRPFIDDGESALAIHHKTGFDINIIIQVLSLVVKSEYKRRQAAMPFMCSEKVFGDSRRLPIAAQWRF